MQLPGLITVTTNDQDAAESIAMMLGESFLEEEWTRAMLSELAQHGVDHARILAISRAIFQDVIALATPYQCVYTIENFDAAAIAYLASDLGGVRWSDIENKAFSNTVQDFLLPEEAEIVSRAAEKLAPISDFGWYANYSEGSDFIHFADLGVAHNRRGTGAFRRLTEPFFAYADAQGIPCFLETYSDMLESLYEHIGFITVDESHGDAFDLYERKMMRAPKA